HDRETLPRLGHRAPSVVARILRRLARPRSRRVDRGRRYGRSRCTPDKPERSDQNEKKREVILRDNFPPPPARAGGFEVVIGPRPSFATCAWMAAGSPSAPTRSSCFLTDNATRTTFAAVTRRNASL